MTARILCEGPDDVAALREIAILLFHATVASKSSIASPAGQPREAWLTIGGKEVRITASTGGKTNLPAMLAGVLRQLPPEEDTPANPHRFTVVYDPDGESNSFSSKLATAIKEGCPGWVLQEQGIEWEARRQSDGAVVRGAAVAWRAPGNAVPGLPNFQNLERLLCHVAAQAYPKEASLIPPWLDDIVNIGRSPCWKSALHLWCALVEPKATTSNAPARFLHQDKACRAYVEEALTQSGLLSELAQAFESEPGCCGVGGRC